MIFEGSHVIEYAYSKPVFIEPHIVRLRPRTDGAQHLRRYEIRIDPEPQAMSHGLDEYGNPATWVWFSDLHESLTVSTRFEVETGRTDPFDYLLTDADGSLPLTYTPAHRSALEPALDPTPSPEAVRSLAEDVMTRTGGQLLPFLARLTTDIYERCEVIIRDEGDPLPSETTLRDARGSCRDLVVLYMDCCRHAGIAARFVSGYEEGDPDQAERHLHAWAEVFVPGGGWRGYDPTHGLAVSDRHVALAAATTPAGAAPTSGTLRGTGATAKMTTHIELGVR